DRPQVANVAPGEGEVLDPRFFAGRGIERHVERPSARPERQARQHRIERINRKDARDPREARRRGIRAKAQPGPALLGGVARWEEEDRLRSSAVARREEQPGILGLELGEVEERVVLAEIVVLDDLALDVALMPGG